MSDIPILLDQHSLSVKQVKQHYWVVKNSGLCNTGGVDASMSILSELVDMPNNYGYIEEIQTIQVLSLQQQFVAMGYNNSTFAGYTPGYIDAYVNSVRQLKDDYNATDTTTVVLIPLANNDNVELVAYKAYDIAGSLIIRKSDCIRKPYSHRTYSSLQTQETSELVDLS